MTMKMRAKAATVPLLANVSAMAQQSPVWGTTRTAVEIDGSSLNRRASAKVADGTQFDPWDCGAIRIGMRDRR